MYSTQKFQVHIDSVHTNTKKNVDTGQTQVCCHAYFVAWSSMYVCYFGNLNTPFQTDSVQPGGMA
jgi:hypothetical protein